MKNVIVGPDIQPVAVLLCYHLAALELVSASRLSFAVAMRILLH